MNRHNASVVFAFGVSLLIVGCGFEIGSSKDSVLDNAPRPGIIGEAVVSTQTDHPYERDLTFKSRASDTEIRSSFEVYVKKLGLTKSADPVAIVPRTLYESKTQGLAISVRELDANTREVVYYHEY